MRTVLRSLASTGVLLTTLTAAGASIPYLTGRVNDNAGILSEGARRALTERLKAHEEKTTNQVVVLTVSSLEGENIEDYAEAVFAAWKLGQKGKDNGILVVVAPNDRRMRIEVGYGLEGRLPDGAAGSIIRNVMAPRFNSGDFDGGVEAGVDAILSVLETGKGPELAEPAGAGEKGSAVSHMNVPDLPLTERILLGAFIFGIIGLFTVLGVMTPGMGWFLYVFLIPFWAMFPIIIVGTTGAFYLLITYLVAFPAAKLTLRKSDWYKKAAHDLRTKGRASIGGFSISSGGSGTSWSSGGSSSSFSGGGGSSGGGGASGSW
jgi:uncharacterized protein